VTNRTTAVRAQATDLAIAVLFFVAGAFVCFTALRSYRAAGIQPAFYQGNFEPAVMMACGHGFHTTTYQAIPPSLRAFLDLKSNTFACADLPADVPLVPVTWNGTWYYLYGATALVWKITGLSWTALDALAAVLGGAVSAMLFALLRIVSARSLAAAVAALLTLSPANLTSLLSLRDYSKAPFVLAAVFVLARLLIAPRSRAATIGHAVLFGAIVGIGYGFRGDLLVLAPFGVGVITLLLPGASLRRIGHSVVPAAAAAGAFLIAGAPPLQGLGTGGCQFHYSLLGMTAPLVHEAAVEPALYSVGDHFTDTFIDLKVGDYAHRVLGRRAPILCDPDYDVASGALFRQLALTFPADLAVHAYGAVLTVTRTGFEIPDTPYPFPSWLEGPIARRVLSIVQAVTHLTSPLGPVVTIAAVGIAWAVSARLGVALTVFVLFLGGYPAIEFESRHWFHLRFIPWWSAALVITAVWHRRSAAWTSASITRALFGVVATLAALVAALAILRSIQSRSVRAIIAAYSEAATTPIAITRSAAAVDVDWNPTDYGTLPEHRSSDLLVITLDPVRCAADRAAIRVRYDVDVPSHDLTTIIPLTRAADPAAHEPTRLFVPVFANGLEDHSYLRFARLETIGTTPECVTAVATMADRMAHPLWIQVQAPGDWRTRSWYQTLRRPRFLR
jgi:hypothetical protein